MAPVFTFLARLPFFPVHCSPLSFYHTGTLISRTTTPFLLLWSANCTPRVLVLCVPLWNLYKTRTAILYPFCVCIPFFVIFGLLFVLSFFRLHFNNPQQQRLLRLQRKYTQKHKNVFTLNIRPSNHPLHNIAPPTPP